MPFFYPIELLFFLETASLVRIGFGGKTKGC